MWEISRESLSQIVKESSTITEILKKLGFRNAGNNYRTLKERLKTDSIDFSHIKMGLAWAKGKTFNREKIPLEEILIKNSTYARYHLKKRLIKENILENKCKICGIFPTWNGKELVLVLDHLNGIPNDNRLENLRFLCPNCNSQTSTFAGRKLRKV